MGANAIEGRTVNRFFGMGRELVSSRSLSLTPRTRGRWTESKGFSCSFTLSRTKNLDLFYLANVLLQSWGFMWERFLYVQNCPFEKPVCELYGIDGYA